MALLDRSYRNYDGPFTRERIRFMVPLRYALEQTFSSRLFLAFFLGCLLWPLAWCVLLYLRYNAEALAVLELDLGNLLRVDAQTFRDYYMAPQGALAFLIVLIMGPALVSPDLRNNAMPLYLARPFSRRDYILGKLGALFVVLSAITWIPGWLLFAFQAYLAGGVWLGENLRVPGAMLLGFIVWILVLSFLALLLSAWVKWKPLARILFLGVVLVLSGMGEALNLLYRTEIGNVLSLDSLRDAVWDQLFAVPSVAGVSALTAWFTLLLLTSACAWLLTCRIRAYEVVR